MLFQCVLVVSGPCLDTLVVPKDPMFPWFLPRREPPERQVLEDLEVQEGGDPPSPRARGSLPVLCVL